MKQCQDPHHVMLAVQSSVLMPPRPIFLGVNFRAIWQNIAYSYDFRVMSLYIVPSHLCWEMNYLVTKSFGKLKQL